MRATRIQYKPDRAKTIAGSNNDTGIGEMCYDTWLWYVYTIFLHHWCHRWNPSPVHIFEYNNYIIRFLVMTKKIKFSFVDLSNDKKHLANLIKHSKISHRPQLKIQYEERKKNLEDERKIIIIIRMQQKAQQPNNVCDYMWNRGIAKEKNMERGLAWNSELRAQNKIRKAKKKGIMQQQQTTANRNYTKQALNLMFCSSEMKINQYSSPSRLYPLRSVFSRQYSFMIFRIMKS